MGFCSAGGGREASFLKLEFWKDFKEDLRESETSSGLVTASGTRQKMRLSRDWVQA
jgi:hypothetical protein